MSTLISRGNSLWWSGYSNSWVRSGMPKGKEKHEKTELKPHPKKKRTLNPLAIFSPNFTTTPIRTC